MRVTWGGAAFGMTGDVMRASLRPLRCGFFERSTGEPVAAKRWLGGLSGVELGR